MKKISFIIPAYNAEKYISKALDSVISTFDMKEVEILVVNDGSSDKTLDILNQYKDYITVFNQKNSGVSKSRNRALKKASGEWVVFLDADDWIDNEFAEKFDLIYRSNYDIVFSNICFDTMKDCKRTYCLNPIVEKNILYNSIISINFSNKKYSDLNYKNNRCIGGKIFKMDIIKKYNIEFSEKLVSFEDGLFILNYLKYTENISFWDYSFYHYRIVSTSASHKMDEKTLDNVELIYNELENYIISNNLNELESIPYFRFDLFRICVDFITKKYKLNNIKMGVKKIKILLSKYNLLYNFKLISYKNLSFKEKIIFFFTKNRMFLVLYLFYYFK